MWWVSGDPGPLVVSWVLSAQSADLNASVHAAAEEKKEEKKEEEEEEEDEVGRSSQQCCLNCGTACVAGILSSWLCVWHQPVSSIWRTLCRAPACFHLTLPLEGGQACNTQVACLSMLIAHCWHFSDAVV